MIQCVPQGHAHQLVAGASAFLGQLVVFCCNCRSRRRDMVTDFSSFPSADLWRTMKESDMFVTSKVGIHIVSHFC